MFSAPQEVLGQIFGRLVVRIQNASDHRWSRAVRRGLLTCLPLVMLGAFSLLINHLPIQTYQSAMADLFGAGWKQAPELVWRATSGIIAIAMTFSISFALAQEHPKASQSHLTPAIIATVSLPSFFLLIRTDSLADFIPFMGNQGAFAAIFTGIFATEIFLWLRQSRLAPIRWFSLDADPSLPNALMALLPALVTVTVFFALGQLFYLISEAFGSQLSAALQAAFQSQESLGLGALTILLLIHLLWFFGIHGNIALEPLQQAHFATARASELSGWVPHEVFTKTFYDVFVYQGGAGCTLSLLLAVLLIRSSVGSRRVAKFSLPCALINVNEPVLFGFPVVLNPFYLVPFVLTPLALFVSALALISIGVVPPPTVAVEWTTPPVLGGVIATNSWRGGALQVFNLVLGVLIYLPFVRMAEAAREARNLRVFDDLMREARHSKASLRSILLRQDCTGNLARLLAADLAHDISNKSLKLEYQPLANNKGRILGVEALLRWEHSTYGPIAPSFAISLAEESACIHALGRWVIDEACAQLAVWNRQGLSDVRMSINVSPQQISDPYLLDSIRAAIERNQLKAGDVELEIAETAEIQSSGAEKEVFAQLAALGVRLAIDDFGMGYSSLLYLRRFSINTIKIDGSLTRDLQKDKSCQEIIMSIATLCSANHTEVVAPYVETREQMKLLYSLGCYVFQGNLFSPALPAEECVVLIYTSRTQ